MIHCNLRSVTALVLAMGAIGGIGASQAVTQGRVFSANATSYCQSALPVFDGQIRKRPLAVQNEGDANAFVTCSFTRQNGQQPASQIQMYVINTGAVDRSVTCTLVTGIALSGATVDYAPKTMEVTAGSWTVLTWTGLDFGGMLPNDQYSMSCNLQPGIGLAVSHLIFSEDVGQ